MDYSAALRKNLGASPPTQKATHHPAAPIPANILPPEPSAEEEEVVPESPEEGEEVVPEVPEEGEEEGQGEEVLEEVVEDGKDEDLATRAGYFGWILEEEALQGWHEPRADGKPNVEFGKVFAQFLGPSSLCALARTCRFLYRAVFSSFLPLWSFLSFPEPSDVVVKFFIDISPVEEGQKENISTVPLSQVKSEYQKNQLVKFWLRTLSNAHAAREKQIEQSKKDDPLLAEKAPLKAVLKGGFAFFVGKADKALARTNDLSLVFKWLSALESLLKGEKSVTVPCEDGNVSLVRVGRGGHLISVTVKSSKGGKESALFDFGSFSNGVRAIAKRYFKIVGSCRAKLQKPQPIPQPEAWNELSAFLKGVLAHDPLNQVLSSVRKLLTQGAIPHSTLPVYFKRKEQEKAIKEQIAVNENGSIVNFLLTNLPPTLEETKKARDVLERKLKQQVEEEFEERQQARQERFEKERQARREAFEAERLKKEGKKPKEVQPEKEKEKKAAPYKVVKEVGADGFETKVKVNEEGKKVTPVVTKVSKVDSEEKKVKVKVPESVSASANPYKVVLLAGDSGSEIKEAKPAPQPKKTAPVQPQQQKAEPKKKPEPEQKVEEPAKKKNETKTVQKAEEPKKKEKTKPPKQEEETEVASVTAPAKQKVEKVKTKSENKEKKQPAKKGEKQAKKPKSEEDQGRVVAKQPSVTDASWFTPTLAFFLLVLAVSALYTLFLS